MYRDAGILAAMLDCVNYEFPGGCWPGWIIDDSECLLGDPGCAFENRLL